MPTVVVPDIPDDVYERLRQRADGKRLSLGAEVLVLVTQALRQERQPAPRLPDFVPGEEVSAPFDLPRPSNPTYVAAHPGEPRFPDPVFIIWE